MMKGRPRLYADERVRELYALYQQGIPPRILCEGDLKAARNLYNAFRRLGLPLLSTRPHIRQLRLLYRDEEIIALHRHGLSNAEIGRRYNLTRERVAQILEVEGIPRPPKNGG